MTEPHYQSACGKDAARPNCQIETPHHHIFHFADGQDEGKPRCNGTCSRWIDQFNLSGDQTMMMASEHLEIVVTRN